MTPNQRLGSAFLALAAIVSLTVLPVASPAAQGKMYKCGSQFQDRPCTGAAPAVPAAAVKPVAQSAQPSRAEENRRQIRCDNWGRQVLDLREREKKEQNADAARGLARQRGGIETRMKGDHCEIP